MITEIKIKSRFEIVAFYNGITNYNLNNGKPFILISCFGNEKHMVADNNGIDTPNTLLTNEHKIKSLTRLGMVDYVNVHCEDITEEHAEQFHREYPGKYLIKLFNKQNAIDCINFIEKYKNEDVMLVVHCDAGISRSGAIGTFFAEKLGIDKSTLPEYIRPNPYILKVLNDTFDSNN